MLEGPEQAEQFKLRNTAFRALAEERALQNRLAVLQSNIQKVEQALCNTRTTTQTSIETYAKHACLQLTTSMMAIFPRELRDMVFRHLSTRPSEIIQREHFRTTLDPKTRLYSYDHARWKAEHFPDHFWNVSYTGAAFHRELMENYYRTSTFIFNDDARVMSRFLLTDEFKLDLHPRDLVQNVEIKLSAMSYDRGSFSTYMYGVPKAPEKLREALAGMFELRAGARVKVCYATNARKDQDREEHVRAALQTLFDGVQRAKLKGYEVSFLVDDKWEFDLEREMKNDHMMTGYNLEEVQTKAYFF